MAIRKEPPKKSTALVAWDEQLAQEADQYAGQEANVAGGQFFSLRGAVLTFDGAPLPGNQMAVIILDGILENALYEGEFDPDNPTNPTCFAFGRDEATQAPHETVVAAGQAQAESCTVCSKNEWGSADRGRGKACGNRRRLALIPAGALDERTGEFVPDEDPAMLESAAIAYLKLPPTAIKPYAAFVKGTAGALRRPPWGIYTRVKVVTDPKTQFRVEFHALGLIPDGLMDVIKVRHDEAVAAIEFPYQLGERAAPVQATQTGKAARVARKY